MEIAGVVGESVIIVSPDEYSWFLNLGGLVMDWLRDPEIEVHVVCATHRSTSDMKRLISNPPCGVKLHYLGWSSVPDDPISNGEWVKAWNNNHPEGQRVETVDDVPSEWQWAMTQGNIEIPSDLIGRAADSLLDNWLEYHDDSALPLFPLGTAGPVSEVLYKVSHRIPSLHYLEWPSATNVDVTKGRIGQRLVHSYQVDSPLVKATLFRRIFMTQTQMFGLVRNLGTEMVVGPRIKI